MVASLEIGPDQGGCRSFRSVPAEQPKPRFICLALLVSCVLGIISNPAVSNPVPARRPQVMAGNAWGCKEKMGGTAPHTVSLRHRGRGPIPSISKKKAIITNVI